MSDHDWRLARHDDKYVYRCADCGAEVEAGKDEDPEAVSQRFVTLRKCAEPKPAP